MADTSRLEVVIFDTITSWVVISDTSSSAVRIALTRLTVFGPTTITLSTVALAESVALVGSLIDTAASMEPLG